MPVATGITRAKKITLYILQCALCYCVLEKIKSVIFKEANFPFKNLTIKLESTGLDQTLATAGFLEFQIYEIDSVGNGLLVTSF